MVSWSWLVPLRGAWLVELRSVGFYFLLGEIEFPQRCYVQPQILLNSFADAWIFAFAVARDVENYDLVMRQPVDEIVVEDCVIGLGVGKAVEWFASVGCAAGGDVATGRSWVAEP